MVKGFGFWDVCRDAVALLSAAWSATVSCIWGFVALWLLASVMESYSELVINPLDYVWMLWIFFPSLWIYQGVVNIKQIRKGD